MIRVKRPLNKVEAVETTIRVLEEEVEPKFGAHKKYLRSRHKIHEDLSNRYFKLFLRIYEYMEELRGPYKNRIELMLEDYFTLIYERSSRYKRFPNLNSLGPGKMNKLNFEDWIYSKSAVDRYEYWITERHEIEMVKVEDVVLSDVKIVEV